MRPAEAIGSPARASATLATRLASRANLDSATCALHSGRVGSPSTVLLSWLPPAAARASCLPSQPAVRLGPNPLVPISCATDSLESCSALKTRRSGDLCSSLLGNTCSWRARCLKSPASCAHAPAPAGRREHARRLAGWTDRPIRPTRAVEVRAEAGASTSRLSFSSILAATRFPLWTRASFCQRLGECRRAVLRWWCDDSSSGQVRPSLVGRCLRCLLLRISVSSLRMTVGSGRAPLPCFLPLALASPALAGPSGRPRSAPVFVTRRSSPPAQLASSFAKAAAGLIGSFVCACARTRSLVYGTATSLQPLAPGDTRPAHGASVSQPGRTAPTSTAPADCAHLRPLPVAASADTAARRGTSSAWKGSLRRRTWRLSLSRSCCFAPSGSTLVLLAACSAAEGPSSALTQYS